MKEPGAMPGLGEPEVGPVAADEEPVHFAVSLGLEHEPQTTRTRRRT